MLQRRKLILKFLNALSRLHARQMMAEGLPQKTVFSNVPQYHFIGSHYTESREMTEREISWLHSYFPSSLRFLFNMRVNSLMMVNALLYSVLLWPTSLHSVYSDPEVLNLSTMTRKSLFCSLWPGSPQPVHCDPEVPSQFSRVPSNILQEG